MDTAAPATKPEIALDVVDSSAACPPPIPSIARPEEVLLGFPEAGVGTYEGTVGGVFFRSTAQQRWVA